MATLWWTNIKKKAATGSTRKMSMWMPNVIWCFEIWFDQKTGIVKGFATLFFPFDILLHALHVLRVCTPAVPLILVQNTSVLMYLAHSPSQITCNGQMLLIGSLIKTCSFCLKVKSTKYVFSIMHIKCVIITLWCTLEKAFHVLLLDTKIWAFLPLTLMI